MNNKISSFSAKRRFGSDFAIAVGLAAVLLFFIGSGFVAYSNTRALIDGNRQVAHTHEVLLSLSDILSIMKDAETGQRGYVLTGEERYLEPYRQALARIAERVNDAAELTRDNQTQQERIPAVKAHINAKLSELNQTIALRRTKGFQAALAVVTSDRGVSEMDSLRIQIGSMQAVERDLRARRLATMAEAYRTAVISSLITCALGVMLSLIVAYLIRRATIIRQRQEWFQAGELGLSSAMFGDLRVEQLGNNILKFLAQYFDAHAGVFYTKEGDGFRRVASYGIADHGTSPERFVPGDGLLGQAAQDNKAFIVQNVPEGYVTVSSALGYSKPRHLIVAAASADEHVNAVFELGFLHPMNEDMTELLDQVSEAVGVAVRSANYRSHLQNLLEETQRQAEELQAQSEELRVSNEELEEQSRALKESQMRLEQQQAELEQTNAQLEEQTQQLETQRDDLARVSVSVQQKARELEQASQYKSDFLANMSHELRTPLNSSLILAKLLADNTQGNLTPEQIKFAQTIQSSGNDLLSLINDILDLSKIEAGHMEVQPESVSLHRVMDDLSRVFEPVAQQKGISFQPHIAGDCPDLIETDRQRLEQILKNLLSNAFKFTDKGSVSLRISREGERVSFAVIDTGIGISEQQQASIFDAFRQADGTISRKYGGTGLGLSISRELARLLGGSITLSSEAGKGSIFTLTIGLAYDAQAIETRTASIQIAAPSSIVAEPSPVQQRACWIEDDRNRLSGDRRVILVVEDDPSFARILYDLAHELDFQCLITGTAEEAIMTAKQYMPHAIVLDVGLPDHSGLSVLDRLKRNAQTRHIPVHVVSAADYAQTAMSLGAVGYMLKPVKREELAEALKQFETRFAKGLRRVLIVEDDDVQRDSMRKLLDALKVETVGVGTAAECLAQLKDSTFDCMILDLSLPDATGYALLETLSQEDTYAFPPVIVYTGRDLSAEEEKKLRRYSKSIIIKGAKSPERLLDEVTLFLHQVVSDLPAEQQRMLEKARNRDEVLEGRHILVVEDDIRNVYALTNILEPHGVIIEVAHNGREALEKLDKDGKKIDLILMDVMMPEMDGLTATREIRKRKHFKKMPIIMLTAKAMRDDQERCLDAGANDYMAKPLDVEKLLSLVRVWMPR